MVTLCSTAGYDDEEESDKSGIFCFRLASDLLPVYSIDPATQQKRAWIYTKQIYFEGSLLQGNTKIRWPRRINKEIEDYFWYSIRRKYETESVIFYRRVSGFQFRLG